MPVYHPPLRINTERMTPGTCLSRFQTGVSVGFPVLRRYALGPDTGIHPAFANSTSGPTRSVTNGHAELRKTVVSFHSSEYLTPILCRNLRSYAVSTVGFAFGRFADAGVKHSRQQSERGFTVQTFLRQRGHRQ